MEELNTRKIYDIAKIMRVALDQYIFLITPAGNDMDTLVNFEEKFK